MGLLDQAFQYIDRIQQENILDECNPLMDQRQSASAPLLDRSNEVNTGVMPPRNDRKGNTSSSGSIEKKKKSNNGVVKKLRSQTQANANSNKTSFDTSSAPQEAGSARNVVDFDALVANFENGITLNQLKAELERSKESMKKSEDSMREITKEFSKKVSKKR
jgi:hypothetical protein